MKIMKIKIHYEPRTVLLTLILVFLIVQLRTQIYSYFDVSTRGIQKDFLSSNKTKPVKKTGKTQTDEEIVEENQTPSNELTPVSSSLENQSQPVQTEKTAQSKVESHAKTPKKPVHKESQADTSVSSSQPIENKEVKGIAVQTNPNEQKWRKVVECDGTDCKTRYTK